jgi:hypothetical protein
MFNDGITDNSEDLLSENKKALFDSSHMLKPWKSLIKQKSHSNKLCLPLTTLNYVIRPLRVLARFLLPN